MKNIQTFDDFVNEAKKPITIDELEKFLKANFKNDGDKNHYNIGTDKNASKDENPVHVWIDYDIFTKRGYARAEGEIFFDLDAQSWFDNFLGGGEIGTLANVKKIVNKEIRDEKKQIAG